MAISKATVAWWRVLYAGESDVKRQVVEAAIRTHVRSRKTLGKIVEVIVCVLLRCSAEDISGWWDSPSEFAAGRIGIKSVIVY
jgi:hypothetical protein